MDPSLTIVRIKRKRGVEPLDALVFDQPVPSSSSSKRYRPSLGPDQLPAPLSRGQSPAPTTNGSDAEQQQQPGGLFRLAETVDLNAFETARDQRELRERINALLTNSSSPGPSSSPPRPTLSNSPPPTSHPQAQPTYRIVRHQANLPRRSLSQVGLNTGSRSGPGGAGLFKVLDAVEEPSAGVQAGSGDSRVAHTNGDHGLNEEEEDMMKKFTPMLEELSLWPSSRRPPEVRVVTGSSTSTSQTRTSMTSSKIDDFVYDIYYRVVDPSLAAGAAGIGGLAGSGGLASVTELGGEAGRIGALLGISQEDLDPEEMSDEEDEVEDEADEDSNEEDYYKNDYPDEENSGEDERWRDSGEEDDSDDDGEDSDDGYGSRRREGFF